MDDVWIGSISIAEAKVFTVAARLVLNRHLQ